MKKRLVELWIEITSDKQKAILLAVVTPTFLLAVGRVVVGPVLGSARAGGSTSGSIMGSGGGLGEMGGSLGDAAGMDMIEVARPDPLRRNLFLINERYFPPEGEIKPDVHVGPKLPAGTDDRNQNQSELDARASERLIAQRVERLTLRSTMIGKNPIAVIESVRDGKRKSVVLRTGDEIEGMEIREIRSHSVILGYGETEVELRRELQE